MCCSRGASDRGALVRRRRRRDRRGERAPALPSRNRNRRGVDGDGKGARTEPGGRALAIGVRRGGPGVTRLRPRGRGTRRTGLGRDAHRGRKRPGVDIGRRGLAVLERSARGGGTLLRSDRHRRFGFGGPIREAWRERSRDLEAPVLFAERETAVGVSSGRGRAHVSVSDVTTRRARVGRARRACAPRSDALPKTCPKRRTRTVGFRENTWTVAANVLPRKSGSKKAPALLISLCLSVPVRARRDAGRTVRRRACAAGALCARAPSEDIHPLVRCHRPGVDGDVDVVRAGVRSGLLLLLSEHRHDARGGSLRGSGSARSLGGPAPAALNPRHGRLGGCCGRGGEGGIRGGDRVGRGRERRGGDEATRLAKGASVRSRRAARSRRKPRLSIAAHSTRSVPYVLPLVYQNARACASTSPHRVVNAK